MDRIKRLKRRISESDNRGDALILVIVAMFLIMFLGLSLLFATYTAYMIRHTERKSETTFTSADTGMDLIRNGLTDAESKAAETGYSKLLNLYSQSSNDIVFKKQFVTGLKEIGVDSTNGSIDKFDAANPGNMVALFPSSGASDDTVTKYSVKAVETFLKTASAGTGDKFDFSALKGTTRVHSTDTDPTGVVEQAKDGSLILKNLHLEYTTKDGYVTTITTDIRMNIPDITMIVPKSGGMGKGIASFCCIADKGIINYDNDIGNKKFNDWKNESHISGSFDGSVYAGSIKTWNGEITVPENQTIVVGRTNSVIRGENDSVVGFDTTNRTDGSLDTVQGTKINVNAGGTLWTQDINLKNGSDLEADDNSRILVADDLNFAQGDDAADVDVIEDYIDEAGNKQHGSRKESLTVDDTKQSKAVLKGTYFGFGSGDKSGESSSITFNNGYKPGMLDISGIKSLVLAGRSFVLDDGGSNEIEMSPSITTRAEQVAYLVPSGKDSTLGEIYNPALTDEEREITATTLSRIADNQDRKGIFGLTDTLANYGITSSDTNHIGTLTWGTKETGQQTYYFFKLDRANANKYFKDYFNAHADRMNEYIRQYSDIQGLDPSKITTAGTGISKDDKDDYDVADEAEDQKDVSDRSKEYTTDYRNLSESLDEDVANGETPFFTYIDWRELHEICGSKGTSKVIAWWTDQNTPDNEHFDKTGLKRHKDGRYLVPLTWYKRDDKGNYLLDADGNKIPGNPLYHTDNNKKRDGKLLIVESDASGSGFVLRYQDGTRVGGGSGERAGYAAWGNVQADDINSKTNFAVVDGDIRLKNPYEGMIICSGTITLTNQARVSVSTDPNVNSSYGYEALTRSAIWRQKGSDSTKTISGDDWTLDDQVTYENWKKN